MWVSGKIALIALVRASDDDSLRTRELVGEIREALQSSAISKTWTIEKITILDDADASVASRRILQAVGKIRS